MAGNPPFDKDVGAIAELAGGFKTANFSFRAPSFATVAGATTSNMTAGSGQPGFPRNSSFFAPAVRVPRQSLLFYVTGEDDKGMPFQRALQAVIVTTNGTVPGDNTTATYPNSTAATGKPSVVPTAGAMGLEVSAAVMGLVTMMSVFAFLL